MCCSLNWFKSLLLPQRKGTPYSNMTPAVSFVEQPQHTILAKHTSGFSIILTLFMLVSNNREMRKGTAGWEALLSSKQCISSAHAMLHNLAIKTSWKNLETTLVSPGIRNIYDASQDLVRNQVLEPNFKVVPGKQMTSFKWQVGAEQPTLSIQLKCPAFLDLSSLQLHYKRSTRPNIATDRGNKRWKIQEVFAGKQCNLKRQK